MTPEQEYKNMERPVELTPSEIKELDKKVLPIAIIVVIAMVTAICTLLNI